MGWTRSSNRAGRGARLFGPECLEGRRMLSLAGASPASSGAVVQSDGSVDFDRVIQASAARSAYHVDGTGSNVAVIDTGVDYNNPALGGVGVGQPGGKVVAGVDFTGSPNGVLPVWQHGTGVAGLIASNDPGDTGVAPGAGIVALRVFGDDNQGSFSRISQALQWVVQNHSQYNITAVNLSVSDGGNYQSNVFATDGSVGQAITTAVGQLDALNIPVVVAAGNSFDGKTQGEGFASIIPDTISVTATDETKMAANKGNDPLASDAQRLGAAQGGASATDIAAPGVNIKAASGSSGTAIEEGTSFATPQVTGTVVLLQQMYRAAYGQLPTVSHLDALLTSGADKIKDSVTGIEIGRLNVMGSLKVLANQIQATQAAAVAVTPTIAPVTVAAQMLANPTPNPTPPASTSPSGASTSADASSTLASTTPTLAPTNITTTTPTPVPTTEVFVNGTSIGPVATSQLSQVYSRLFALTRGTPKDLRAWVSPGSSVNLGTSQPSGETVAKPLVGHAKAATIKAIHLGHHAAHHRPRRGAGPR